MSSNSGRWVKEVEQVECRRRGPQLRHARRYLPTVVCAVVEDVQQRIASMLAHRLAMRVCVREGCVDLVWGQAVHITYPRIAQAFAQRHDALICKAWYCVPLSISWLSGP